MDIEESVIKFFIEKGAKEVEYKSIRFEMVRLYDLYS